MKIATEGGHGDGDIVWELDGEDSGEDDGGIRLSVKTELQLH